MGFSRILVPTDFSTSAEHAARAAVELAAALGGSVELVHLYNPPSLMLPDGSTFAASPAELVAVTDGAEASIASAVRALRSASDGRVRVEGQALMGSAADEILRLAESGHYDLIVMGTHGRTGIRRLMLGSVAEKVLRRASIPVLTVRLPHAAESVAETH
jgi:nucleotide-binding universal stress UspA family protein